LDLARSQRLHSFDFAIYSWGRKDSTADEYAGQRTYLAYKRQNNQYGSAGSQTFCLTASRKAGQKEPGQPGFLFLLRYEKNISRD
jgi:hypothetical protein